VWIFRTRTSTIGGTQLGEGNLIAYNGDAGVRIAGEPVTASHRVSGNSIHSNGGLGIDLGNLDVTANDPGDGDTGANGLQNFPVLSEVVIQAGQTLISGSLNSAADATYRIELFANREADPSGHGEGETFLGSTEATTDGSGNVTFEFNRSGALGERFITATATRLVDHDADPNTPLVASDTSEFSAALEMPPLVVTTTADLVDDTDGLVSLREAITYANAHANVDRDGDGTTDPDVIWFAIRADDAAHFYYRDDGVAGQMSRSNIVTTIAADDSLIADIDPDHPHSWFSIQPATALPDITNATVIDGYTQPGASENTNAALAGGTNAVLRIEIDGSQSSSSTPLELWSAGSTVRGLAVNNWSGAAIAIVASSNRIEGSFLGTDISGTIAQPNKHAVVVTGTYSGNVYATVIGGTTAAARNVLSGNRDNAIELGYRFSPADVISTQIVGNYIGVARDGTAAIGNASGVYLDFRNRTTRLLGNVISGNRGAGVAGVITQGGLIQGNLVGTDATGTLDVGNRTHGVSVGGPEVMIGGPQPEHRNVISGNDGFGISADPRNVILGNYIGTQIDGVSPLGNSAEGIWVNGGTGTGRADGNVIAYNGGDGIEVYSTSGYPLLANSIFSNAELGIELELSNTGPTPNDPGDGDTGSNNLQNFPVLLAAAIQDGQTVIAGSLNSAADTTYRIELFSNREADPSGHGEGEAFLGFTEVTTDGSGNAGFEFTAPGTLGERFITATATRLVDHDADPDTPLVATDTSEFSLALQVPPLVVTTTADVVDTDGLISLREAITYANAHANVDRDGDGTPDPDAISFAIPGSGVQTISLNAGLPVITDPVVLDGYTQPGASPNTLAVGNGAVLLIELDATRVNADDAPGAGVVTIGSGGRGSTVRGLVINRTQQSTAILLSGGGENVVEGNFLGVGANGATIPGDTTQRPFDRGDGIYVSFSENNRIGGTDPAARNVIAGHPRFGIALTGATTTGNVLQGNYIGTTADGAAALGGQYYGAIFLSGASGNTIGGTAEGAGNLVSGNDDDGILLSRSNSNVVQGNRIGTDAAGTSALPNSSGIVIFGSHDNLIGGVEPGAGNVIASNGGNGVEISTAGSDTAAGNSILGNSIFANGGLGIDLRPEGVSGPTPNDPGDADDGPNALQNFPVVSSAVVSGGTIELTGTLDAQPGSTYRVEFFASRFADSSGYGAGAELLGAVDVAIPPDATESTDFTVTLPAAFTEVRFVTATATDAGGNTSEFSEAVLVNRAPNADAGGPYAIDEGDPLSLDASLSSDPDEDSLTFTWDVNGDGVFGDATGATPTLSAAQLADLGLADDGTFTVTVRVEDAQGGRDEASTTLTVNNVAPTVDAGGDVTLEAGTALSRAGSFTDPGADDWTATVDYGDGSGTQALALNGDQSFSLNHDYAAADTYTVTVTVHDGDGGTGQDSFQVTVGDGPDPGVDPEQLRQTYNAGIAALRNTLPGLAALFTVNGVDLPVVTEDLGGLFGLPAELDAIAQDRLLTVDTSVSSLGELVALLEATGVTVECVAGDENCDPGDLLQVRFTHTTPGLAAAGAYDDTTPSLLTDLAQSAGLDATLDYLGDLVVDLVIGVDAQGLYLEPSSSIGARIHADLAATGELGPFGVHVGGPADLNPSLWFSASAGKIRPDSLADHIELSLGQLDAELALDMVLGFLDYVDVDASTPNSEHGGDPFVVRGSAVSVHQDHC
jgi:CSLREA domain-containing protein